MTNRIFFSAIVFLCACVFFAACNPEEPQYSPQMNFSVFEVYHADSLQTKDTLHTRFIDEEYTMDTIVPGDTVRYFVLLNAVTNQLTSFSIKTDTTNLAFSLTLNSDFDQALDASSDVGNCLLNFKPGYAAASFSVDYIAKKSGSPKVTLTLSSTSKFSPTTISFRQPVK